MRIRRGLASRRLPCGCIAGVYETYRERVVVIVDARGAACADPDHAAGKAIPALEPFDHPPRAHDISHD